ncbi:hypothetical protein DL771_011045 [Monosporascus sp. 5C6A]|nr:hypothetical protein DL771_011045 [Monosporascus sp. 5C6A]
MDVASGTQRVKVSLAPTQSTLLLTLYARVVDAQRPAPIINDTRAVQVLNQVEHDPADLRCHDTQQALILLRARQLDEWTADFLESHSEATVLHLACGLDSRCLRLNWGPKVRWIDVDFPDVVDLRAEVYENPEGDYQLISADVTDDAWLKQIPTDRPTAVVFEGLTPYLEEATGKALIRRLAEHFKTGQLIFDTVGPLSVSLQSLIKPLKKAGAKFTWGTIVPLVGAIQGRDFASTAVAPGADALGVGRTSGVGDHIAALLLRFPDQMTFEEAAGKWGIRLGLSGAA